MSLPAFIFIFFFFNDTATTEIYTLSLHDALPISIIWRNGVLNSTEEKYGPLFGGGSCLTYSPSNLSYDPSCRWPRKRSEEHTSELQSRLHLVCRLLLEKKKKQEHPACHYTNTVYT